MNDGQHLRSIVRWSAILIGCGLFLIFLQLATPIAFEAAPIFFPAVHFDGKAGTIGPSYNPLIVLSTGAFLMALVCLSLRRGTGSETASGQPGLRRGVTPVFAPGGTASGNPTTEFKLVPLPDYVELPAEEMLRRAQDFYDEIRRRHTVRDFSTRPVPRDLIELCIAAAGTAPSAANLQPWHFVLVGSARLKNDIRAAVQADEEKLYKTQAGKDWLEALKPLGSDIDKPFLETAPWLICIFGASHSAGADGTQRKNRDVAESVSIAAGFLIAALHRAGLATLTHAPVPSLTTLCSRPQAEKPYLLLAVGYPAPGVRIPLHATEKKPLQDIRSLFE